MSFVGARTPAPGVDDRAREEPVNDGTAGPARLRIMVGMDERLAAVARSRGGAFTSRHAGALDVDDAALTRLRRSGEVVRLRRDAYVLGDLWSSATPEQRLALRVRCLLATRGDDVASHQSALALHGLPLYGVDLGCVDVLARVKRVRTRSGLRAHPRAASLQVVVADGYRCVPVAHAVAQVLATSGLIAAMAPLDAALHQERCSLDHVTTVVQAMSPTPRLRDRAEELAARADAASESVGETGTRLMLLDHGFEVRSQVDISDEGGSLVGRVDFLVGGRVVVEFDGAVKYDGVDGRAALVAEKRREDALRALGYAVVRLGWVDLERPAQAVARIRRALAQSSILGAGVPAS